LQGISYSRHIHVAAPGTKIQGGRPSDQASREPGALWNPRLSAFTAAKLCRRSALRNAANY
jgi:hypothetical protein